MVNFNEKVIPLDTIRYHATPFFREFCAYGHIHENGLNGTYTTKRYCHLAITGEMEAQLIEHFKAITSWEVPKTYENGPSCVVVKTFLDEPVLSDQSCKKDMKALKAMNERRITILNVGADNLLNGNILSLAYSEATPFYREIARESEVTRIALSADLY